MEKAWEEDIEKSKSICIKGSRRIGDSLSWRISLEPTGVIAGAPETVLEYSLFNVQHYTEPYVNTIGERFNPHYEIAANKFVSCVLKYEYTFQDQGWAGLKDFWPSLAPRLESLTYIELQKLDDTERPFPMRWDHGMGGGYYSSAFRIARDPPKGWTFWDDHVARWHEVYCRRAPEEKAKKSLLSSE